MYKYIHLFFFSLNKSKKLWIRQKADFQRIFTLAGINESELCIYALIEVRFVIPVKGKGLTEPQVGGLA